MYDYFVIAGIVIVAFLIGLCIAVILEPATKERLPKIRAKSILEKIDVKLKGTQPFSYFEMKGLPDTENLSQEEKKIFSDGLIERKVSTFTPSVGTMHVFYIGEPDGTTEHVIRTIVMFCRLSMPSVKSFGYPYPITITEDMKDDLLLKHNIVISWVAKSSRGTDIYFKR